MHRSTYMQLHLASSRRSRRASIDLVRIFSDSFGESAGGSTRRSMKTPCLSSAGVTMWTDTPLCHHKNSEEQKHVIVFPFNQPFSPQQYIHREIIYLCGRLVGPLWVSDCGVSQQAQTNGSIWVVARSEFGFGLLWKICPGLGFKSSGSFMSFWSYFEHKIKMFHLHLSVFFFYFDCIFDALVFFFIQCVHCWSSRMMEIEHFCRPRSMCSGFCRDRCWCRLKA